MLTEHFRRLKFIPWILIFFLPPAIESAIHFGSNLRSCEIDTRDAVRSPLVHCKFTADYTLCVDSRFRCNFAPDCPYDNTLKNIVVSDEEGCAGAYCTFEDTSNTVCGWNLANDDYAGGTNATSTWRWRLRAASTLESFGGPRKDHTLQRDGAGHFLLADLREAHPGDRVMFQTPIIGSSDDNCTLEFYYFIGGNSTGKLQIVKTHKRLRHSEPNATPNYELLTKILDTISLTATGKWKRRSISWHRNEFYTVTFTLTLLASDPTLESQGFVAIDDIRFINCTKIDESAPQPDPFGHGCPDDMFNCMENNAVINCVRPQTICDGVVNCPSGLDESSCSCDDLPLDFCQNGECILHNETLKPTCLCSNGSTGADCNETFPKYPESSGLLSITVVLMSAGAAMTVLTLLAWIVYKLIWRRRRWAGDESVHQGYDVTFFLDTAHLRIHPRVSSSSRMFRNNNISNSDLLVLDNEWGMTD